MGDRPLPDEVERIRGVVTPDLAALAIHTDVFDGFLRHLAGSSTGPGCCAADALLGPGRGLHRRPRRRPPGAGRGSGDLRPAAPRVRATAASTGCSCATPCRWSTSPTRPSRSSSPGTLANPVAPRRPVSVRRDRSGVPARAGRRPCSTLAREQGRVTAHDRAWQLEVERLAGRGQGRRRSAAARGRVGRLRRATSTSRAPRAGLRRAAGGVPGVLRRVRRRGARRVRRGRDVARARRLGPAPGSGSRGRRSPSSWSSTSSSPASPPGSGRPRSVPASTPARRAARRRAAAGQQRVRGRRRPDGAPARR